MYIHIYCFAFAALRVISFHLFSIDLRFSFEEYYYYSYNAFFSLQYISRKDFYILFAKLVSATYLYTTHTFFTNILYNLQARRS